MTEVGGVGSALCMTHTFTIDQPRARLILGQKENWGENKIPTLSIRGSESIDLPSSEIDGQNMRDYSHATV